MRCVDCCYHWADPEEGYAYCHFNSDSPTNAPCEYEEEAYVEEEEDVEDIFRTEYIVYGVGRHSDALVPMDEVVLATDSVNAREVFELRHPEYRSTSAYKLNK